MAAVAKPIGNFKPILQGIKVLDLTQVIAGPSCTSLLAEMGAEVIKIELAPGGDRFRFYQVHRGRGLAFVRLNRGKKSVGLNTRMPAAREVIRQLAQRVDVLVENFAPGVVGRLGIDYESLKQVNPGLIMCSISAFGQTGPLASLPGFDYLGACYAGALDILGGEPDGSPTLPGVAIGDYGTSVQATCGIGYALFNRSQTGEGQYLDVSLLDTYFYTLDWLVLRQVLTDYKLRPKRLGLYDKGLCPQGLFKAEKHWLCILIPLDKMWRQLCTAMDRPDLARHPEWGTNAKRVEHHADVIKLLQDWVSSKPEDEILGLLNKNRVPVAPVLSVNESVQHPHLRQRGTVRKIRDRVIGEVDMPGFPIRFSKTPANLDLQAPFLGEHNNQVLEEFGFSPDQIAELKAQGVLIEKTPEQGPPL